MVYFMSSYLMRLMRELWLSFLGGLANGLGPSSWAVGPSGLFSLHVCIRARGVAPQFRLQR